MGDNLSATLSTLAAEVNELEAQRTAGNQGKMVEMGHKLIAIRQILREVNGARRAGVPGADGQPPNGWNEWVKNNLLIGGGHCMECVKSAINPAAYTARTRRRNSKRELRPATALRCARKGWPVWTHEQREQFSTGVLELLRSA